MPVSKSALDEIDKLKTILKETEDTLEAIGPGHVLYATLKVELEQLKKNLEILERFAKL